MLPEVGGTELLVIAAVALIVVGPKDLPMLLRKLGQFVARLRAMADDFRASFDEMARQSELDDLRKEVEAMRRGQVLDQAASGSANAEITQVFDEIQSDLQGSGVQFHPPMSHQYDQTPATTVEVLPSVAAKPRAPRKPKASVEGAPAKPRKKASRSAPEESLS